MVSSPFKDEASNKPDELMAALATLQSNLEQQQSEQRNLIASLTAQWEQRFASVLQCLKTTTNTAASMNERSSKFLRLGEVLEGALDQMSSDSKDVSSLSQKVNKIEANVNWLAEEVAEGRFERSKMLSEASRRRPEAPEQAESNGFSDSEGARDAAPQEWAHGGLERLSFQLSEECAERRKLAREVRSVAADAVVLRGRLDTTNDQVLRLSRELNDARSEVRQVAGELSRAWSAEISGDSNLRVELRNEFSQRLDSLGRELRGELAARTAAAAAEAAPMATARSAAVVPAISSTAPHSARGGEAAARPASAGGSTGPDTLVWRSQGAGPPRSTGSSAKVAAPRVEPLRKDLVKEIAAAMAGL